MMKFKIRYHAGGFIHEEVIEASRIEDAEAVARERLDAGELYIKAGQSLTIIRTALVAAVEVKEMRTGQPLAR